MGKLNNMIKIINGVDGWKFIDMSETSVLDAFNYLESSPIKTSFFLDAARCDSVILEIIADQEKVELLKAVHLINNWKDISALRKCKKINTLSIGFENSIFDFSSLSELTSIGGIWSKRWSNLENCKNLSDFSVAMFDANLTEIPNISKLKNISLIQPKVSSLNGIEQAEELLNLRILRATKLVEISAIQFLHKKLVDMEFDKCKNINDYSSLSNFGKIEKLIIADCKSIDSIKFVSTLKNLKIFSIFGTVVKDGNLLPCLDLPKLIDFRSESIKSYHPSVEEIRGKL